MIFHYNFDCTFFAYAHPKWVKAYFFCIKQIVVRAELVIVTQLFGAKEMWMDLNTTKKTDRDLWFSIRVFYFKELSLIKKFIVPSDFNDLLILLLLCYFKYFNFFFYSLLHRANFNAFDLFPLDSFYLMLVTFQLNTSISGLVISSKTFFK